MLKARGVEDRERERENEGGDGNDITSHTSHLGEKLTTAAMLL